ncbi:MAG TPA: AI-2E family transporter [Patescibacteria group bacterium]|nr:AI-2E family transporter [Patescibacteria group bacterium]
MTIRLRTAFFAVLGIIILWFLYIEREILTPFVLAGIFAYIINPLVNFLSHKLKLPRTLSVVVIYLVIIGSFFAGGLILSKRIVEESSQIDKFIHTLTITAGSEVNNLPDWMRPSVHDALAFLNQSKLAALSPSLLSLFPKAISGIISLVIFLFSSFFFLKEGRNMIDRFLNFLPNNYRIEVEILLRKINTVFGGYLRGQLILVTFVSVVLFIALSYLGIKFALILAVFSGFAEIVPFVGPIVAGIVAAIVAFTTQTSNFNLSQVQVVIIVALIYFVLRQFEDYFVTPYVMGKITKLHPIVILFAVLAGGHIAGILGLILAVPVAAIIRILLEFSFDKINDVSRRK